MSIKYQVLSIEYKTSLSSQNQILNTKYNILKLEVFHG
jgi:hypothetical protein